MNRRRKRRRSTQSINIKRGKNGRIVINITVINRDDDVIRNQSTTGGATFGGPTYGGSGSGNTTGGPTTGGPTSSR